jgi:hypothetical protein
MMRRHLVRSGLLLPGALTAGTLSLIRGRAQPVPAGPKFIGIDGWINSAPISVEQLQGTVVLVNFWTYSCINGGMPNTLRRACGSLGFIRQSSRSNMTCPTSTHMSGRKKFDSLSVWTTTMRPGMRLETTPGPAFT